MDQHPEPEKLPERTEHEPLEPLVERFAAWYRSLNPEDQNAAFLMTSGLASAMAKEQSRYSPDPGFFERYVATARDPAATEQNRTSGTYDEHASRLEPPLAPTQLARVAHAIFVAPYHEPLPFTSSTSQRADLNNP